MADSMGNSTPLTVKVNYFFDCVSPPCTPLRSYTLAISLHLPRHLLASPTLHYLIDALCLHTGVNNHGVCGCFHLTFGVHGIRKYAQREVIVCSSFVCVLCLLFLRSLML